jgi:hypothetical protein
LGQAIRYMQDRWQELTQFLRVPGAPLDNNATERILKRSIEAVRDQTRIVDLKQINRVLIQPHWRKDCDQPIA